MYMLVKTGLEHRTKTPKYYSVIQLGNTEADLSGWLAKQYSIVFFAHCENKIYINEKRETQILLLDVDTLVKFF